MRCDCNARFRIYNLLRKLYHSMEKVSSQSLKKRIRNFGKHAPSPRQKYTKKAYGTHRKSLCLRLFFFCIRKSKTAEHMRDTLNGVSRITLFACGEFYCAQLHCERSDIRLTPSDIRYASFWANRISLQGKALQYHFLQGKYHSSRQRRISLLVLTKKERIFRIT